MIKRSRHISLCNVLSRSLMHLALHMETHALRCISAGFELAKEAVRLNRSSQYGGCTESPSIHTVRGLPLYFLALSAHMYLHCIAGHGSSKGFSNGATLCHLVLCVKLFRATIATCTARFDSCKGAQSKSKVLKPKW
jgi:hypothetical protein